MTDAPLTKPTPDKPCDHSETTVDFCSNRRHGGIADDEKTGRLRCGECGRFLPVLCAICHKRLSEVDSPGQS
jgi:hypothetical protein